MRPPIVALADLVAARHPLVVVAHPDDEVLGCGLLLTRWSNATVVHVTDGAPRSGGDARRLGFVDTPAYAAARWAEARRALALAGVAASRHHGLGIADQDAAYRLHEVARRLMGFVAHADLVLTHAYEGGHPDHDAVAFAVVAAVRAAGRVAETTVVEMPFYHAGPDRWVRQRFLPHEAASEDIVLDLAPEDVALKRRLVECHLTQAETLSGFGLDRERFRIAPPYDFTILPNDGHLLYERHGWNLTGEAWRSLVRQAMTDFGLPP